MVSSRGKKAASAKKTSTKKTKIEQVNVPFIIDDQVMGGVEKVFAIQAGREVRVIVTPDDVDDARMTTLSEEIARRIESELQYPGQIKVVLIRETRAVDFAR